jgi:hypothetical protein
LFAICINAYTGLVAVNVANADQRKLLLMIMWFGICASAVVQLQGSMQVAGFYFVFMCSTNRFGLLAGIPRAIRTRDGR